MAKLMRALGVLLAAIFLLLGATLLVARMHDGPLGPIAGGPLEAGELRDATGMDWSFAAKLPTIELQLLEPPRSRTVWVVVEGNRLFVPCGFLDVPLWKQWPHEAVRDGRAVVRIAGQRFPVRAVRVEDPALVKQVESLVSAKYEVPLGESAGTTWVFELLPRTPAS